MSARKRENARHRSSFGARLPLGLLGLQALGCAQVFDIHALDCHGCADATHRVVCDDTDTPVEQSCGFGICDAGECVLGDHGQVISLSASSTHACAVTSDGTVWCWGDNSCGELGRALPEPAMESCTPTTDLHSRFMGPIAPVEWQGESQPAVQVAVGLGHTCVISVDGALYCWGSNLVKQLGAAEDENLFEPSPVRVATPEGILFGASSRPMSRTLSVEVVPEGAGITAGFGHTCALSRDNRVFCWGANYLGQCARDPGYEWAECPANDDLQIALTMPDTLVPVPPSEVQFPAGDEIVTTLRTVKHTTCALTLNSSLYCWGANQGGSDPGGIQTGNFNLGLTPGGGQLGIPTATCFHPSADTRVRLQSVSDFSLGFASTYVRTPGVAETNGLFSWGMNASGQLGRTTTGDGQSCAPTKASELDPNAMDENSGPVAIPGGNLDSVAKSLSSEGSDQCAVTNDGKFWCWGFNDHGELGTSIPQGQAIACATPLTLESHGLLDLGSAFLSKDPTDSTPMFGRGADFGCIVAPAHGAQVWCWGDVPGYEPTGEAFIVSTLPAD